MNLLYYFLTSCPGHYLPYLVSYNKLIQNNNSPPIFSAITAGPVVHGHSENGVTDGALTRFGRSRVLVGYPYQDNRFGLGTTPHLAIIDNE